MKRQVLVFWDGDVIRAHVFDGTDAIRVGPDAGADVILPVAATLDRDGEHELGAFVVSVTRTRPGDVIRAPLHLERSVATIALSAVLHALVFAFVIGAANVDTRTDENARIAAMQGYLARSSDREAKHDMMERERVPVVVEAESVSSAPKPVVLAAPNPTTSHAQSGGPISTPKGSVRVGDWVGTYTCLDRTYGLVLHIDNARGMTFHVVGSATSPDGIQASYKQRGVRDPATGVSKFYPDGWLGEPMAGHNLSGMHGQFAGDSFSGMIDDPQCGSVSLHRHA